MAYKRPQYKEDIIKQFQEHHDAHGIILHPVSYFEEKWGKPWIKPLVVSETSGWTQCYDKFNQWIQKATVIDNDQYVFISDDDAFPPGFFDLPSAEVIITSIQRGQNCPPSGKPYPPTPLIASPDNMRPGEVDLMQMIVRGDIVKKMHWHNSEIGDGLMAEWLKFYHTVIYMPNKFGWFNYLQPGRWTNKML